MVGQVRVTVDDRAVKLDLTRAPERHKKAAKLALSTVARSTETRAVDGISKSTGVPKSRIRWHYTAAKERNGRRLLKLTGKGDDMYIGWRWSGRTRGPGPPGPIPIIQLPGIKQLGKRKKGKQRGRKPKNGRNGVSSLSGRIFIEQAFIAAPRTNPKNPHVFKRRGAKRYPIDVQRFDLNPDADIIYGKVLKRSARRLQAEFDRQMARIK